MYVAKIDCLLWWLEMREGRGVVTGSEGFWLKDRYHQLGIVVGRTKLNIYC